MCTLYIGTQIIPNKDITKDNTIYCTQVSVNVCSVSFASNDLPFVKF